MTCPSAIVPMRSERSVEADLVIRESGCAPSAARALRERGSARWACPRCLRGEAALLQPRVVDGDDERHRASRWSDARRDRNDVADLLIVRRTPRYGLRLIRSMTPRQSSRAGTSSRRRRRRGRGCAGARPSRPRPGACRPVPRSCQTSSVHCARPVAPSGWPFESRPPDGLVTNLPP